MSFEMDDSVQARSNGALFTNGGFDVPQAQASTEGWKVDSCEVTDVDMEPVAADDGSEAREQDQERVVIIGQDGYQLLCSSPDICAQSAKLWDMLTTEQGETRMHSPLCWQDIKLLVDGMKPHELPANYLESIGLERLVRAIELYLFYEFYEWDVLGIEEAMLDCLVSGHGQRHDEPGIYSSRFDFDDPCFASKVRCAAQHANMIKILRVLDKRRASVGMYEVEEERPRKWQKVSARSIVRISDRAARKTILTPSSSSLVCLRMCYPCCANSSGLSPLLALYAITLISSHCNCLK